MTVAGVRFPVPIPWGARSRGACGQPRDELAALQEALFRVAAKDPVCTCVPDSVWRNYRVHAGKDGVSVSGSSQPYPSDLAFLVNVASVGLVLDLREDPHFFVKTGNRYRSFSYINRHGWPNPGIDSAALLEKEERLIADFRKRGALTYVPWEEFKKRNFNSWKTLKFQEIQSEAEAISRINEARKALGLPPVEYLRIPVSDQMPPEPRDVDRLVEAYRAAKARKQNVHFHCIAGRGRTTTALVITRMMDGYALREALDMEANPDAPFLNAGTDLRRPEGSRPLTPLRRDGARLRLAVLCKFEDYWQSGKRNATSFSQFLSESPIDRAYLNRVEERVGKVSFQRG